MRNIPIIIILVGVLGMISCSNSPQRPETVLNEAQKNNTTDPVASFDPGTQPPTPPTTNEPPQNADGVWHYTCPSGCEGGAGGAQPCANCGATLVHNTAYHGNPSGPTTPAGTDPLNPNIINTNTTTTVTPPATPNEPPQNAAGVWHYTCPNGCAGGGGAAGPCPGGCGGTLAHNSAYHQ